MRGLRVGVVVGTAEWLGVGVDGDERDMGVEELHTVWFVFGSAANSCPYTRSLQFGNAAISNPPNHTFECLNV